MKPVAVLPLHVWDRELDSRLHIAYTLLQVGYDVLVGHEHTLAALYDLGLPFFHFGAGRPVQNNPRSTSWYPSILKSQGFVGLCYEEGINDLSSGAESHFAGISHEAVFNCSKIYGWSEAERDLAASICPSPKTSLLLESKYNIVLNTRFEILTGQLGGEYYSRRSESINTLFGDYILISDNFGIEAFGTKEALNPESNFKQFEISEADRNRLLENTACAVNNNKIVRQRFVKCIAELVKKFPFYNFVLRPHPVADPRFWHEELAGIRNVTILYKDSCEPWLFSASAVIHSGCTLGLQCLFTGTPTIDVSQLINDHRNALSSSVANIKPSSMDDLFTSVKNYFLSSNYVSQKSTTEAVPNTLEEFFTLNLKTSAINVFNAAMPPKLNLSQSSMLLKIKEDATQSFSNNEKMWRRFSETSFNECLLKLPLFPPNANKSRYFSLSDIKLKFLDVIRSHRYPKRKMSVRINKLPSPNVFMIKSNDDSSF